MASTPAHFTRDPSLSAGIADQFGGGAGNAEQLIDANNLRYSTELVAAQMLPGDPERTAEFDHAEVAKIADLEEENLLAFEVHGEYLVYIFEGHDGRTGKDILHIDDGDLVAPERADTPQRAALRASVEAAKAVNDAKGEADKVLADARAEAAKIIADAAAEAEATRVEAAEDAAKQAEKDEAKADKDEPKTAQSTPRAANKAGAGSEPPKK